MPKVKPSQPAGLKLVGVLLTVVFAFSVVALAFLLGTFIATLLERVGLAVGRVLGPLLGKYRPTPATAVAKALVASCKRAEPGVHVLEANEIQKYAR